MKKSKHKNTDQDYLHVVEFSQGKPNEISFNVLGKKSSASAGPEKKGFRARLRRKNKGSYEGFGASMALGVEKTLRSKMRFLATLRLNQAFHVRQQQMLHQEKPEGNMRNLHKSALAGKPKRHPSFLMLQGLVQKPIRRSVVVKNNVRAAASSAYCWWF